MTDAAELRRTHRTVRAFIAAHPVPEPHDPLRAGLDYLVSLRTPNCASVSTTSPDKAAS